MTLSQEEKDLRRKLEMFIRNVMPPGREWMLIMRHPDDDETIWNAGHAKTPGHAVAMLIGAAYGAAKLINEGSGLDHREYDDS